jgi:hypothetical protein
MRITGPLHVENEFGKDSAPHGEIRRQICVTVDVDSVHLIDRDREQVRRDGRRLHGTFLRKRTDMFEPEISTAMSALSLSGGVSTSNEQISLPYGAKCTVVRSPNLTLHGLRGF